VKTLVFGHWLEIGGTQVNAIELAATLRDVHGHSVLYFATPGPMQALVEEKRLRYAPAPPAELHPSPARMRALHELIRRERPDVVHAWDWWQALDAYYVAHLLLRVPMVVTDMSMGLVRLLPKALPTTFGTPELAEQARAAGRGKADVLLPPVDVAWNAPGAVDPGPLRREHGVGDGEVTFVSVSRLSRNMKSEPLWRLIDVVRQVGRDVPVRFLIVGDGEARPRLAELAAGANAALGREAVTLVGPLLDPRPAYAAADVVVGMGGSAMRGMAFGKAVLVVGERGFAEPLEPSTAGEFLRRGLYGLGDGDPGNARLAAHVRALAADRPRRDALGELARRFVTTHFALGAVAAKLDGILRAAAAEPVSVVQAAKDGVRTALVWARERRFLRPEVNARLKALLVGKPRREFSLE
jgi:glycosyltransferase involved in cell wall biosynthesis